VDVLVGSIPLAVLMAGYMLAAALFARSHKEA
jgi:hypothetical protein